LGRNREYQIKGFIWGGRDNIR